MNLERVTAGRGVPNDVNVIIEIPMNADPVKYEVDKETGAAAAGQEILEGVARFQREKIKREKLRTAKKAPAS